MDNDLLDPSEPTPLRRDDVRTTQTVMLVTGLSFSVATVQQKKTANCCLFCLCQQQLGLKHTK
jgi:hypothetical protein